VAALLRQLAAEDPSIPEEILTAWKNAVQSKSKNAKSALFAAFLKAGKNWGQLLGLRPIYHTQTVVTSYGLSTHHVSCVASIGLIG